MAEKAAVGEEQPGAVWGSGELLPSHRSTSGDAPEGRDTGGAGADLEEQVPFSTLQQTTCLVSSSRVDIALSCRQHTELLLGALGEAWCGPKPVLLAGTRCGATATHAGGHGVGSGLGGSW